MDIWNDTPAERRAKRRDQRRRRLGWLKRFFDPERAKKRRERIAYLIGMVFRGYTGSLASWAIVAAIVAAIGLIAWKLIS